MNNIKYIGIDVLQATSVFAVSNREGRIVAEAILETRATEIIDFLKSNNLRTLWVTLEEGTYFLRTARSKSFWVLTFTFYSPIL